jgi:hypothetical protein
MSTDSLTRFPVFVIGDSRTGTLSLHNFFIDNKMKSIHYYVKQARQTEPLHENVDENRANLKAFLATNSAQCYTDYPTRFFFEELWEWYPDALFILSTRSSTERWLKSMATFYDKFGIVVDRESLRVSHEAVNDRIRNFFADKADQFLELCIDDGNDVNTEKLERFLGVANPIPIGNDNSTESIDNSILSKTHQLYRLTSADPVGAIERVLDGDKAFLSEYGWVFLANDTNRFLDFAFGKTGWTEDEGAKAVDVLQTRAAKLQDLGIKYIKYIIPEKSVVYKEYLPRVFGNTPLRQERPAVELAKAMPDFVHYLADYLLDARSYGQLYFRGDSHTNWLGAWFVYCYIIRTLPRLGLAKSREIVAFKDLLPRIAAYEGDLFAQLNPGLRGEFEDRLGFTSAASGLDLTIQLLLPEASKKARRVETPQKYREWFTSRETFVYERPDGEGLKKAVIFRDSTLDFCHELIAQHFSRSVFVWHQGQVFEEVIREENPDVVLHIMAERFVSRYPSFVPLVSADGFMQAKS